MVSGWWLGRELNENYTHLMTVFCEFSTARRSRSGGWDDGGLEVDATSHDDREWLCKSTGSVNGIIGGQKRSYG